MAASDWSERTRMIVTVVVALLVNGGLGAWLYMAHGEWKKLDTEKKASLKKVAELRKYVNEEGAAARAQLAQLERDSAEKEKLLPEAEQVEKLIDEMIAIAARTNCQLISSSKVAGTGPEPGTNYERSTWKTRWSADFFGWCELLNEMEERFPRFISFENMQLQPRNSGVVTTGSQHDISVDVVTYRYIKQP